MSMDQGGLPQDASGGSGLGQLQRLWLSRLPIRWPMSGQCYQSVSQGRRQFGQVRGLTRRQIRRFANVLIYMIEFPLRVLVEVDRLPTVLSDAAVWLVAASGLARPLVWIVKDEWAWIWIGN